ncbi:venom protease-like [Adelges cooleyi]|uniref:venom protease-like n=1 Tax=Adelges cooleyi TaxID=133065 RepID=UPI00217F7B68|nr:venom protease-like [Adelges cooleyi]
MAITSHGYLNLMFGLSVVAAQSISHCTTPSNRVGNCINILKCASLRSQLVNHRANSSVMSYLRNSQCGYEGKFPKVCCPSSSDCTDGSSDSGLSIKTRNPNNDYYQTISTSKIPNENSCGRTIVIRDRIAGGEIPKLGEWSWAVTLGYRNKYKPYDPLQWSCGGSLISDRYVLTSAYCTIETGQTKLSVARLGDLSLDPDVDDGASPQDIPIEKIIAHESYDRRKRVNDIALLKLESAAVFNKHVQPICLPTSQKLRSKLFVKYTPTVVGWGTTRINGPLSNILMEVGLPVVDNMDCNRSYSKFPVTIDNRVLCAGSLKGGKGSCQGDSGNTLMIPQSGQWYSIGIVSFGYKCGESGYPGVYTRVTYFVDWILGKLQDD